MPQADISMADSACFCSLLLTINLDQDLQGSRTLAMQLATDVIGDVIGEVGCEGKQYVVHISHSNLFLTV